jgi:hypothetical protein
MALDVLRYLVFFTFMFPRLILSDGPSECFFLDKSSALAHEPCVPASDRNATTHSTCCNLGQPVGNSVDLCTSQGLCYAQMSSSTMSYLYQGGCTDSNLADAACRWPCAPLDNGRFLAVLHPHPMSCIQFKSSY